jgi:iron complex transport system substrate-binding protein
VYGKSYGTFAELPAKVLFYLFAPIGPWGGSAIEKTKKSVLAVLSLCVLALSPCGAAQAEPERILSLAPAATEIIFDLGLGGGVVGVTEYCTWPPEAREKANVGDMMRVNMETILSLDPDLVALSNMNEHLKGGIEALGYPVIVVYQDDFAQICDSMLRVGEICGIAAEARKRVGELRKEAEEVSARRAPAGGADGGRRVLVVVGRDEDDAEFRRVHVAGMKSFYEDILTELNARNAFTGDVPYASITREGLMRIDPDIVIELIGEHGMSNVSTGEILAQWDMFDDLSASRNGGVAVIRGDFTLRAGPRYPKVLSAFAMVINEGVRAVSENEVR